jgi:threonine synthase
LRVPGPLGDRLMLRALRDSGGGVVAVDDGELQHWASQGTRLEGVDFSPEGGATLAAARVLLGRNVLRPEHRVVLFNTGAGWLYRSATELPGS